MHAASRFIALLLCVCVSHNTFAQTPPNPKPTATVQGRVTLEGAPYGGGVVMLQPEARGVESMLNASPVATAVTDGDGRYRFAQVVAGKYRVRVHALAFVTEPNEGERLTISEGDAVENQDFKLSRSGVITGKVTDPEGHPRIDEIVKIVLAEKASEGQTVRNAQAITDDRGVFRLFGLPAGRYKVNAGHTGQMAAMFNSQPEFVVTYHPGTDKEAEAKLVEVRAGAEAEGVDIVLLRTGTDTKKSFTVSGQIFDTEAGKPVAGSMLMLTPTSTVPSAEDLRANPPMPTTSDAQGQFRFNNVTPGGYQATLLNMQGMMTGEGGASYADPLKVTVTDADVTGLEIKLKSGATVQGSVALDLKPGAPPDPSQNAQLANLILIASPVSDLSGKGTAAIENAMGDALSRSMAMVKPDQSFVLKGLRAGQYTLQAQSLTGQKPRLARIEQNGRVIPHIEITGTETVTGIRLVMSASNASLKGQVQVQGGTLPAGTRFSIIAENKDGGAAGEKSESTQSDVRGQFNFENLAPGNYEVRVLAVRAASAVAFEYELPVQAVTVAENGKASVVLYVNLKKKENE